MSEGSGSFPSLPTIPAGFSGSDRLLARLGELWLRSKFLFLPGDRALLSSKSLWYNCSFICTGREFVIPSEDWGVPGPLSWMLAGMESEHAQAWKEARSCGVRPATAALTTRLDGDFHSWRCKSLMLIPKQNLPYVPMKLGPSKGDPPAKTRPSPAFTSESLQESVQAHSL